jgi:hypothetical protein
MKPTKRWLQSEVCDLQRLYPDHEAIEIAEYLGRSVVSVQRKAEKLGIKKSILTKKSLRTKVESEAESIKKMLRPSVYEYDFDEIGKELGMTAQEAERVFAIGMKKIVKYVRENDEVADALVALISGDEDFMEWDFVKM